ncbi:MAG: DUF47 family protein [Acidobacteria bacterium]|nr:DUF47 family protein [Acidobacteriota bacterium]
MSFNLLGPNFPFLPLLQAQGEHLRHAAELLLEAFREHPDVAGPAGRIQAVETRAGETFHQVLEQLSLTFLHPIERADLHGLAYALDEALGAVRKIAARLGLYGFTEIRPAALQLAENLAEAAGVTREMVHHVVVARNASDYRRRLARIMEENDMVLLVALGELYEAPPPDAPRLLELVKWARLYDRLEEAALRVHRVGLVLESIILKNV